MFEPIKPEYEQNIRISADILLKQFDITWGQIKHVSVIQVGSLAAWYYLYKENSHILAILLMLFSSSLLFIMLAIIRRQVQLQEEYHRGIKKYLCTNRVVGNKPLSRANWCKIPILGINIKGHVLARAVPTYLIAVNLGIIIFTFLECLCLSDTAKNFTYIISIILIAILLIKFKENIKRSIKFMLVD